MCELIYRRAKIHKLSFCILILFFLTEFYYEAKAVRVQVNNLSSYLKENRYLYKYTKFSSHYLLASLKNKFTHMCALYHYLVQSHPR